jgi:hypothetical protein
MVAVARHIGVRLPPAADAWQFNLTTLRASLFFLSDGDMGLHRRDHAPGHCVTGGCITSGSVERKDWIRLQSRQPQPALLNWLHRGATLLEGTGAYTGSSKKIIFRIITLTELSKMKELVFDIAPHAFMVVNDTLEVIGRRHGSLADI